MQNQSGDEPPVSVDRARRRRRLTLIAGTAMGLGLLTSLVLILAGLFFDSSVPLPVWSDTKVQSPIEAGVDAPGEAEDPISPSPRPSPRPTPVTSTSPPEPSLSETSAGRATTTTRTTTAPAPQPTTSTAPSPGEERRTAKPTKTPGKP